jgi:deoxyribodipyrimidine photo-lyase
MELAVFWFRRDLRIQDNAALYHALKNNAAVLPVFIFDSTILNKLEDKQDRRVHFIHSALTALQKELHALGSSIKVYQGEPLEVFKQITTEYKITVVYTNHDYEPAAIERDKQVKDFLQTKGIDFKTYKDQCIFEKNEVTKEDGLPYTIFTPYSVKWKKKLTDFYFRPYPNKKYVASFYKCSPFKIPALQELGFEETDIAFSLPIIDEAIISQYSEQRNFPAIQGTTRLSMHLRFGTVSIRTLVQKALQLNETWLNELIWRDFYMMILSHFPHVVDSAFKPAYNRIQWRNNEKEFDAWCNAKTGYPIVDAGMNELNQTGFMHNRVRMITASFLVKHLLIDWRWGEAYFAQKLIDFDLSANNGGWQWAAGSGCDAAPYFRVFSPSEQTKKFDAKLDYIKRWAPDFGNLDYPQPIVEHKYARQRVLKIYKEALQQNLQ